VYRANVVQAFALYSDPLVLEGLDETEAYSLIVNGFIEPITKELPIEYAVELNRLIQLEMSGSVG
jgi:Fe-S cluster assembly protein SufB